MAKKKEEQNLTVTLPEGRLINGHLFVKQQYNAKSTPNYSAEVAYEEEDLEDCGIYDMIEDLVEEMGWDLGDIKHPIKDGDKKARKREKKGKDGEAYEGKVVINATTIYNKDGDDDSGGIQVFNEDVDEVDFTNKRELYNGCMVKMGVKLGTYELDDENFGVKIYLTAVQKVGDGERLAASSDHSTLFEKVGRDKKKKKKKRKG